MDFTVLYVISSVFYAFMGVTNYLYNGQCKKSSLYLEMSLLLSLWAFFLALMNGSNNVIEAALFRSFTIIPCVLFYAVCLHFAMQFTQGEKKKPVWVILALLYIPSVVLIIIYLLQPVAISDMKQSALGWVCVFATHKGLIGESIYTLYCMCYAVLIFFSLLCCKVSFKMGKRQSRIIAAAMFWAILTGILPDSFFPTLQDYPFPPLSVIMMLIPMLNIWYFLKQSRTINLSLLDVAPDIFKTMQEGVIIVDNQKKIIAVNTSAIHMLHYSEKEMCGQSLNILLDLKDYFEIDQECEKAEVLGSCGNGDRIPFLITATALKNDFSEVIGYVIAFQDISGVTEMKKKLLESNNELEMNISERTFELIQANEKLKEAIRNKIASEKQVKQMAYQDTLTRLPNRRLFYDRLKQSIFNAERHNKTLAVLFLDLDSFKNINDSIGHIAGDALLIEVGKRISSVLYQNDTIARFGGDEFLILAQSIKDKYEIKSYTTRILDTFKLPFKIKSNELFIKASMGCAIYPTDGLNVETLIMHADAALFYAKQSGKQSAVICNKTLKKHIAEEIMLTNDLSHAIERNEMELYYQPQVDAPQHKIVGFEALLRWNHPTLGQIGPSKFIPIAEKSGLIMSIGEWTARVACIEIKELQDRWNLNIPISINLSAHQFENSCLVTILEQIFKETCLPTELFGIEITESVAVRDITNVSRMINKLKKLGVKVSIDDFGIAYSTLSYLKFLQIDTIKIDKGFIDGIGINDKDEAIMKAIIALSKNLGLNIIAEGVEKKDQLDFLISEGCNTIQGFYFYKPLSASSVEAIMKKREISAFEVHTI
jgi:PAS domain S-box/diguanylate cyclase (GGDEF) domain